MTDSAGKDAAICLLALTKKAEVQRRLQLYADYICLLLNGRLHQIQLAHPRGVDAFFFDQSERGSGCDLLVFGEPDRSLINRLLIRYDKPRLVNHLKTSFLVAREPRHPLKNILLIIRADESDRAAVKWACRLAKGREIHVTCLPVIPELPVLYQHGAPQKPGPDIMGGEGTPGGKYIHSALHLLTQENVIFNIDSQPGEPFAQIKRALGGGIYDLVILAAEPYGPVPRLLFGELVTPLLHWIDRPLLIAKPAETT